MSVMRCPRRATPAQRPSPRSGGAHICGEAKSVGRCADATRLAEPRCTSRRRVRARPAGLSSPPSRGGPPSRDAALRARRLRQISRAKIATPPVGPDRRWRPSGLTTTAPAPTPRVRELRFSRRTTSQAAVGGSCRPTAPVARAGATSAQSNPARLTGPAAGRCDASRPRADPDCAVEGQLDAGRSGRREGAWMES
jgi:hypothetical protein